MELPVLGLIFAGIIWLLRDARQRYVAREPFSPGYIKLLWLAAAVCGFVGLVACAGTVYVALQTRENIGFAGILLLLLPLIGVPALMIAYSLAWSARHPPTAAEPGAAPDGPERGGPSR